MTHLHEAVRYDPGKVVKLLLAVQNVEFNTACTADRKSRQYAARILYRDIVELLVEVPSVHVSTAYSHGSALGCGRASEGHRFH